MEALAARLADLAAAGETITYGALARDLGLRIRELTDQLERLMEEDVRLERPFRAAVCVGRLSQDTLPAAGFFLKAAELGQPITDPAAFVADHRRRLFSSR